jgi:hypothetical protein
MSKRNLLTLILIVVSNLIFAQQNTILYKKDPPNIGKDNEAIVIFQLLSPAEIQQKKMNETGAKKYNQYLKKHAKIYEGKKEFMTIEEIKAIDFSQPNNYKYIFSIKTLRGYESNVWPYNFGLTEIETGITYICDKIYLGNKSKELKKEVIFFEKARKRNASK